MRLRLLFLLAVLVQLWTLVLPGPTFAGNVYLASPSPAAGTVTVSARVTSAARLDVTLDGAPLVSCATYTCSYAWNTRQAANGRRQLSLRGLDRNGAVIGNAVMTVTVNNDVTAPTVSLTAPSSATGTVALSASATDNKGVTAIELHVDGTLLSRVAARTMSLAWDSRTVPDGVHQVQAKAYDAAGNVGTSAVQSISVKNAAVADTTVPAVSVTAPSTAKGVVTVSASATDNAGVSRIDLSLDGTLLSSNPGASLSLAWDSRTVADGSHQFQAKAVDAAGNIGSSTVATVSVANTVTTPPTTTGTTYLTDHTVYAVPNLPRPALRVPVKDPVFGSTITRVSDPTMGSASGSRHEYARLAAISADDTKAIVMEISGGYYRILDLATGRLERTVPTCGHDPSASFHPTDPDRLIWFCGSSIRTMQVSTGATSTLMTFPEYDFVYTREEGTVSDDWRYAAFFGVKSTGAKEAVVVDLVTTTVLARKSNVDGDWIGVSPSGEYVVIMHDDTLGTRLYDRSLTYLRTLHPGMSHDDFAIDADGEDVIVYFAWTTPQTSEWGPWGGRSVLAKVRLRDGQKTEVIDTKWKWGGHVSGIGSRGHPGWVLVSDYRGPSAPQDSPFQREIFWLKLDGSGQVKRIAHHHSDQASGGSMGKDYFAEPHAVASWDGTMVVFASVWGSPFSRYDAYIAQGPWWP